MKKVRQQQFLEAKKRQEGSSRGTTKIKKKKDNRNKSSVDLIIRFNF